MWEVLDSEMGGAPKEEEALLNLGLRGLGVEKGSTGVRNSACPSLRRSLLGRVVRWCGGRESKGALGKTNRELLPTRVK